MALKVVVGKVCNGREEKDEDDRSPVGGYERGRQFGRRGEEGGRGILWRAKFCHWANDRREQGKRRTDREETVALWIEFVDG